MGTLGLPGRSLHRCIVADPGPVAGRQLPREVISIVIADVSQCAWLYGIEKNQRPKFSRANGERGRAGTKTAETADEIPQMASKNRRKQRRLGREPVDRHLNLNPGRGLSALSTSVNSSLMCLGCSQGARMDGSACRGSVRLARNGRP